MEAGLVESFEMAEGVEGINEGMDISGDLEADRPSLGMEQPSLSDSPDMGDLDISDAPDSERPGEELPSLGIEEKENEEDISNENEDEKASEKSENNGEESETEQTTEGLTDEQKKELKERTGWSDEIIDAIKSPEEAEIYEKAGLKEAEINGKKCLIRDDIDLDQKDEDGITNRERMERGRPPLTKDGKEVELHHIGQKNDSPLAELTTDEHRGTGNDTILHDKTKDSEIDRNEFGKERKEHWKARANC